MNPSRYIQISSRIPVALDMELHNLCACFHHESGQQYADTFSQVVRLGLDALNAKRLDALNQRNSIIRKVSR